MNDHDVVIYKSKTGDFIAKFKGADVPDTRGRGPSRFEALGDLLERDAARHAAERGES